MTRNQIYLFENAFTYIHGPGNCVCGNVSPFFKFQKEADSLALGDTRYQYELYSTGTVPPPATWTGGPVGAAVRPWIPCTHRVRTHPKKCGNAKSTKTM